MKSPPIFMYDEHVRALWCKSTEAQLSANFIATPKVRIVRCGLEERITESQPNGQKADTKAYMAGKLAQGNEAKHVQQCERG